MQVVTWFLWCRLRQIFIYPNLWAYFIGIIAMSGVGLGCTKKIYIRGNTVEQSDQQRIRALVDADSKPLFTVLADDLVYVHSNGVAETKMQFIAALESGKYKFKSYELDSMQFIRTDQVIVETGSARIDVAVYNTSYRLKTRYIAVFTRHKVHGWQLSKYQNTRTGDWKD